MKRFTSVLLGTALAAGLSFGAQMSNPPAKSSTTPGAMAGHSTTTTAAKKHSKKKKGKKTGEASRSMGHKSTSKKY